MYMLRVRSCLETKGLTPAFRVTPAFRGVAKVLVPRGVVIGSFVLK